MAARRPGSLNLVQDFSTPSRSPPVPSASPGFVPQTELVFSSTPSHHERRTATALHELDQATTPVHRVFPFVGTSGEERATPLRPTTKHTPATPLPSTRDHPPGTPHSEMVGMEDDGDAPAGVSREVERAFATRLETYCNEMKWDLGTLVDGFCAQCKLSCQNMPTRHKRSAPSTRESRHTTWLQAEHKLWDLVSRLLTLRSEDCIREEEDNVKRRPPGEILKRLFARDRALRKCQCLVDWLEAGVDWGCTPHDARWQKTLSTLRSHGREGMVKHVDPDAPLREHKSLAEEDEESERFVNVVIWQLLRAGQSVAAMEFCRKCKHHWRAGILGGGDPFDYPQRDEQNRFIEPRGNRYFGIWRGVCRSLSEDESVSTLERAIFGILGGNVQPALLECSTWEDVCWALLRGLIEHKIDTELVNHYDSFSEDVPSTPLPPPCSSLEKVFEYLETSTVPHIRRTAREPLCLFQRLLAEERWEELVQALANVSGVGPVPNPPCSAFILRIAVHLSLVLRVIHYAAEEEGFLERTLPLHNRILIAYINHLAAEKESELVALYAKELPPELRIETYAKFLETIEEREERQRCIRLAESYFREEVPAITCTVVRNIRMQLPSLDDTSVLSEISEDDSRKIRAIEWLCLGDDRRQLEEALVQSNALIRSFVQAGKIEAARDLVSKVPEEESIEFQDPRSPSALREHYSWKNYLWALHTHSEWRMHQAERPQPYIAETTTQQGGWKAVSDEKHHHWEVRDNFLASKAVELMRSVLHAEGGWLHDPSGTVLPSDERERPDQIEALRRSCIPRLVFLLHNILVERGYFYESLQIANDIASESLGLYTLFSREELEKFLLLMRESAIRVNCLV